MRPAWLKRTSSFECYISPFEMLQIEADESIEELDVKVIQRGRSG